MDYYIEARQYFTIDEWINVLLSAIDYNPKGYVSKTQKMAMLSRLLPFVEKRINLIELAPKETGKSYVFAQISKYGWLVSGGSISRAKMFYDISKRTQGLVSRYDYVAFDEIQSIKFTDAMEMQGALKGYLESGEYRVGDSRGVGDAGLILLGNIDSELMDVNQNMFKDLPDIFHESALLDRFHGFIKGWNIPKMKESLKANGWALNTEYFGEIMHCLRDELAYRAVVDQLLQLPKNSATRDTEAIKRKFNGPKGIGFLYVREGTPILPLLNGGAQENSLRAGTENVASIVGMATALSMSCSQMQKSQNQSAKMVELICSILNDAEVDYIRNGYSNGLKGTLNLSFRDKDGEAILHRLDLRGILVSTGSACDSSSTQVSHVIRAINVPDSYAKGTIRISLGKDNTLEEAKIIGETLVSVLMEQK